MKWRKRKWHCEQHPSQSRHYWTLKTSAGDVMCALYPDGWVAAINYRGTDADVEISKSRDTDIDALRDAEQFLRRLAAKLTAETAT